ncbi:MAG: glycosyltransferase family 4 protein [Spirochaetes bacterium]|jgi:glycosyltransferase involved in cell wall biosynthesis|nr:glycosyltransferase family 4 protein [Spirochaetota bacterium]
MKVLFDHQIFSIQKFGGISRYFVELMKNFTESGAVDYELALRYSANEHLMEFGRPGDFSGRPYSGTVREGLSSFLDGFEKKHSFPGKTTMLKAVRSITGTYNAETLNESYSRERITGGDFDVFHSTYYSPYFLDCIGERPFVVTFYDLIQEIFFDIFRDSLTISWKKMLLEKACRVIAISENTKNDIMKYYSIPSEKIRVIHLGSSLDPEGVRKTPRGLSPGYLLFIGNRSYYKNFDLLARSISGLLVRKNLHLVCGGGPEFSAAETEMLADLGISDRVRRIGFSSDSELAGLYGNAAAFIFPSGYEGFGIPVLEAFSCGCPVLLSDRSSLPEVGGDAAMYFDPGDPDSLRESVERIINDEDLRKRLADLGLRRLRDFSWKKTAARTVELYREVI